MSLKVTFELEDKDLKYFRDHMKQARAAAEQVSEYNILSAAEAMIEEVQGGKIPLFVQQRVAKLQSLIDMTRDKEWALQSKERKNVVAALGYFADPQDMIPDSIPVLGYVDDAIMIELVTSELKHEIDAYNDFCQYRDGEKARHRNPNLSRDEYLDIKRRELHGRMRRRRAAAHDRARGSGRTRFRLF